MKPWSRLFRVTPTNSSVALTDYGLEVRFGRWRLTTPWFNIVSAGIDRSVHDVEGGRSGPPHAQRPGHHVRHEHAARRVPGLPGPGPGDRSVRAHPPPERHDHRRRSRAVRRRGPPAGDRGVAPPGAGPHPPTAQGDGRPLAGRRSPAGSVATARSTSGPRTSTSCSSPHAADDHELADGQPISSGTGAWFHRRYFVRVLHPTMDAVAAMAEVQADLNVLVDEEMAPFTKSLGVHGQLDVGDRYIVETAGPWNGPVEVIEATDALVPAGHAGRPHGGRDDRVRRRRIRRGAAVHDRVVEPLGRADDGRAVRPPAGGQGPPERDVGRGLRTVRRAGRRHPLGPVEVETERAADRSVRASAATA